jgi:branched-chain amino acid transport system ATP-binding protein
MLEVEGIDTYYGDSKVLRDVSFDIGPGEVVGLLGRNGAGKTTALRSITGIQPPQAGTITFEGESITGEDVTNISQRGIKLVPEDRRPFESLTVHENLELSRNQRHGDDWTVERVQQEFPRLDERSRQKAGQLSGGEQQMLVVAMALVGNPKLVLLDEPMEGLAPQIVTVIADIIDRIREDGIPVLLVEQNLSVSLELIDRGFLLHRGEVKLEGTAEDLEESTTEIERYLSVDI